MHAVLLGDSVFDNAAYVGGGPDVVRQLRERLPEGAHATLRAVDGAVVRDVVQQVAGLPPDATHLVVSAGGNDALRHSGVLGEPARSMEEAVWRLSEVSLAFAADYGAMLDALAAPGLPLALCTIYDPRYPDRRMRRLGVTGLMLFNDAILRAAFARGLAVLDLRLVCDSDADFANPIEPSVQGGAGIASAIAAWLREPPPPGRSSVIVG